MSVLSSSLAVAEGCGGGGRCGRGRGRRGEGGVCDAVGGWKVGETGVCSVWWGKRVYVVWRGVGKRERGECVQCGGAEGGVVGEWGVPSVSCRVVPMCCVCGGEGGRGVVSVSVRVYMLLHIWVWSIGPTAFGGQLPENPGVWVGSYPVVSGVVPACCSLREGIPLPLQVALGLLQSFFVLFSCWGRGRKRRDGGRRLVHKHAHLYIAWSCLGLLLEMNWHNSMPKQCTNLCTLVH